MHRELRDPVLETEDLRILGGALAALGKTAEAEAQLREVIARATEHARPLLVANTERDLANLLARHGRAVEARELARSARTTFDRLRADQEIKKLDALLAILEPATR